MHGKHLPAQLQYQKICCCIIVCFKQFSKNYHTDKSKPECLNAEMPVVVDF